MKIIEKKCPNCGANIKFKVGEHDARCEKCRREFAIEYDEDVDLKHAIGEISAESIRLANSMAGHINENMKIFRIVFFVIFGIAIAVFVGILIMGVISSSRIRAEYNEQWNRVKSQSMIVQ